MEPMLPAGARFHGAYTIVRLIGRGGIGEAYEARHDFLGRRVAIKCMRVEARFIETASKRMAKEAQALCALDHPNIIRIFDAGAVGELAFMVCELLEGGTLRDKLEASGALPVIPALRYHVEWSDALAQVHAAGIIHRDLKPENVFITSAGPSKLLDFGAALDSSQRITVKGHTVGTPAYMAPEHLTGDDDIDVRADIYAMGVMLFESLTGTHPFWSASEVEVPDHFEFARRHLFEPWPRLSKLAPHVPAAVEAIVDRCLQKEREKRYPTMAAMRDALKVALEAASTPAALPLVSRAPAGQGKTKPMPRQTAMRLDAVIGTMRMPPRTIAMGAVATPMPGAALMSPRPAAATPFPGGARPTPAPPPARALPTIDDRGFASPARRPSRAPVYAAVVLVVVSAAACAWALFGRGGTLRASAAPAEASAAVVGSVAAEKPVDAQPSATASSMPPTPTPTPTPTSEAVAASAATIDSAAAEIAPSSEITAKPAPAPKPKPRPKPLPIFE
jgi:serine/threonine-protein kinase